MSSSNTIVQPTIFRQYIGATKSFPTFNDFPAHIINRKIKEFHFILAFATESYEGDGATKRGTGKFYPGWNRSVFNAEKIKNLKRQFEHAHAGVKVKVIISIGGRGSQHPFNTQLPHAWLNNAQKTLKAIIVDFKGHCGCNLIDGIDVNYESIKSSEDVFVDTIGQLIKKLKEDKDLAIKVASIAPSESVQAHYKELYSTYKDYIDLVDYQFYDQIKSISKPEDFEALYADLLDDYPDKNLLAGFSADPNDKGRIERPVFLDGCRLLLENKLLPGIFVWDAEHSWKQDKFQFEEIAQNYLAEFSLQAN